MSSLRARRGGKWSAGCARSRPDRSEPAFRARFLLACDNGEARPLARPHGSVNPLFEEQSGLSCANVCGASAERPRSHWGSAGGKVPHTADAASCPSAPPAPRHRSQPTRVPGAASSSGRRRRRCFSVRLSARASGCRHGRALLGRQPMLQRKRRSSSSFVLATVAATPFSAKNPPRLPSRLTVRKLCGYGRTHHELDPPQDRPAQPSARARQQ